MSGPWRRAVRRGGLPLGVGILCLVLSWPAIEDLDGLLKGLGALLITLGLVITLATARTYTAEESRIGRRV